MKQRCRPAGTVAILLFAASCAWQPPALDAQAPQGSSAPSPAQKSQPLPNTATLPRGKKLILKDGSFQLVREYQVEGDRVRYYSVDTTEWEEIPTALVDWEATKKEEAEEAKHDAAAVAREKKREDERAAEVIDIDASLEAAPGVFLPPGEGIFAFDGKAIFPLKQADMTSKLDKKKAFEKVLVPIPVIPTRHALLLNGSRASLRLKNPQPEFYMRTQDATEPSLQLVRAKVHGDARQIEKVDQILGAERAAGDVVPLQRWTIAQGVYRFTLGQTLASGEYALVRIVEKPDMSFYIWDFGVDAKAASSPALLK